MSLQIPDANQGDFDPVGNKDLFVIAFSSVLFCYVTAKALGAALNFIRQG